MESLSRMNIKLAGKIILIIILGTLIVSLGRQAILNELIIHAQTSAWAGNFKKAKNLLNVVFRFQPDNMLLNTVRAQVMWREGNVDQAAAVWERLAENNPKIVFLRESLGEVYAAGGRYEQAGELFNDCLEDVPDSLLSLHYRAYLSCLEADYKTAERFYRRIIFLYPRYRRAYVDLLQIYSYEHERDRLLELAQEALTRFPEDTEFRAYFALAYFQTAYEHASRGRLQSTEEYYNKAVAAAGDEMILYPNSYTQGVLLKKWAHLLNIVQTNQLRSRAGRPEQIIRDFYYFGRGAHRQNFGIGDETVSAGLYGRTENGIDAYQRKEYAEAAGVFDAVIKKCPHFLPALLGSGLSHKQLSEIDEDKIYGYALSSLEALMMGGFSSAQTKKLVKWWDQNFRFFIHRLQRDVKQKSADFRVYAMLAIWSRMYDKYKEAHQLSKQALQLRPDSAPLWKEWAVVYLRQNNPRDALKRSRKAAALDPEYGEAYSIMGQAYGKMQQHEQAITAYRRAVELNPYLAVAWNNLGIRLRMLGRYQEAIQAFKSGIAADPADWYCYKGLGDVYNNLRDYSHAIEAYHRGLPVNFNGPDFRVGLAEAYYGSNDLERCVYECRKILLTEPDAAYQKTACGYLLQSYARLAQSESFEKILELYQDMEPDDAVLDYYQGVLLYLQKNYNPALEKFLAAIHKMPGYAASYEYAADICEKQNNMEDAERYLRETLKADPRSYFAGTRLAALLINRKKYAAALALLKQMRKFHPGNKPIQNKIAELNAYLRKEN